MIIGRHKNCVFHVNISLLKSIAQAGQYHSCFLKGCGGGVNILPSPGHPWPLVECFVLISFSFYTVNLVYSESGNTFSPEKEENIFTLYNNDIHKIHCYVKYFILVKSWEAIVLPALLFTKIPLRSKGVHVFPSLWTFGANGMLLRFWRPFVCNWVWILTIRDYWRSEILVKDFLTHI